MAAAAPFGGALSVLHFKWLAMFLTAIVDPHKRPYSRIKKLALGAYLAKYLIIIGRGVFAIQIRCGRTVGIFRRVVGDLCGDLLGWAATIEAAQGAADKRSKQ